MQEVLDAIARLEKKVEQMSCGLVESSGLIFLFIKKHSTGEMWFTKDEGGSDRLVPQKAVKGYISKFEYLEDNGKIRLWLRAVGQTTYVVDCGSTSVFARDLCNALLRVESVDRPVIVEPNGGSDVEWKNTKAQANSVFCRLYEDGISVYVPAAEKLPEPQMAAIAHINALLGTSGEPKSSKPVERPTAPTVPAAAPQRKVIPTQPQATTQAVQGVTGERSPFEFADNAWERLWFIMQSLGTKNEEKAKPRAVRAAQSVGIETSEEFDNLTGTAVSSIRDQILVGWAENKTKDNPSGWNGHSVKSIYCGVITRIEPSVDPNAGDRDEDVIKAWVSYVNSLTTSVW